MRGILLAFAALAMFAAQAVAADGAIVNRLDKAKVGEWVMMQDVSGDSVGEKTKVEVIAVRDGMVVIKREHYDENGAVSDSKEHEIKLDRYAQRMADLQEKAKQISRERLTVKDKEMTVQAVSWDDEDPDDADARREFKIWVSEDLPIGGIAKTWSSDPGFPAAEVIDYGF